MRLFCAVPIPETLRAEIRRAASPLRATGAGVKWAKEDQLHFTLAFLGETPPEKLGDARAAVAEAAAQVPSFDASFGAYGAFPDLDAPKVLWLGLSLGEQEMSRLAAALRGELLRRGLPFDDKPFRAHATLGRVQKPGGLKPLKNLMVKPPRLGSFRVERLVLYESKLGPAGSEHAELLSAELPVNK